MDDIYSVLVTMDFPDAITFGLRRTTDAVRGILEKTRGDLTLLIRQKILEEQLKNAEENISNNTGTGDDYNSKRELESVTVDDFSISERTRKVLKENGITNIDKLTELDFDELKLNGNIGVKTIFELKQLAGKLKDSRDILSILRKCGK